MARIPMLPQQPQDGAARELFDQLRQVRGPDFVLPDLYRVLGVAPLMFKAWLDFAWPLRLHAKTPRRVRELLILRGAQVSATDYEWAHHVPMAEEAGVGREQIDALADWRGADCFDEREQAVLQLADEVTAGPAASQATIDRLQGCGFDDAEVVELVLTASFYVCVSRFLKSMDVTVEPDYAHLVRPAPAGPASD